MITEIPLLGPAECDAIVERVRATRKEWVERSPQGRNSFFTVGRAAYLDVNLVEGDPEASYYAAIDASNRLLLGMFGDLFESVRQALETRLASPVGYAPHLAVPGFHIFLGQGIARAGQAVAHFDLQYSSLRLGRVPDLCPPISFTLPLHTPSNGTGLETWNVTFDDYERAMRRGLARSQMDYAARKVRAYYAYSPGLMLLQEGLILHRLSSPGPIQPHDERITFQGHGLRFQGEWMLYW